MKKKRLPPSDSILGPAPETFLRSILQYGSWFLLFLLIPLSLARSDGSKDWALYSWFENDHWYYSLVRDNEKHPDADEVRAASTESLEKIKTRIGLLGHGSSVQLNPLPVLNLELQHPPGNTVKELERVCNASQLTLLR